MDTNNLMQTMLEDIVNARKNNPPPTQEQRQGALDNYTNAIQNSGRDERSGLDVMLSSRLGARDAIEANRNMWGGLQKWQDTQREAVMKRDLMSTKLQYDDILARQKDYALKSMGSLGKIGGVQGYEFRKNSDGTTSAYSKATGAPVGTYGPQDIGKISQMTQVLAKAAFEKGDYGTLDEALQWAQTEAMKQVGGMNQAVGNRTAPLAGDVGGLPTTALRQPASPADQRVPTQPLGAQPIDAPVESQLVEQAPGANFDLTGMGPEDKVLVGRLIARYKANPNEGTRKQLEQSLIALHSSGSIKFGGEQQPAPTMIKKDIPKEKEREATLVGEAKTAQESFNKDIVEPARAFANTAKIMSDFNHLSKMEEAAKSGKVGELLAGETGKWLAAALPSGADLNATITNAQQREKLTSGMINQILMAAKGIQTEGDAQRARSQVTSIGTNPDANAYLEAYMKETSRQLQLRESMGRTYAKRENTYSGHDADWNASPIMREAVGSVKKLGDNWIGLTQYMDLYKQKHGGSDKDAVASWNKVK